MNTAKEKSPPLGGDFLYVVQSFTVNSSPTGIRNISVCFLICESRKDSVWHPCDFCMRASVAIPFSLANGEIGASADEDGEDHTADDVDGQTHTDIRLEFFPKIVDE